VGTFASVRTRAPTEGRNWVFIQQMEGWTTTGKAWCVTAWI